MEKQNGSDRTLTPLRILRGCLCLIVLVLTAFMVLVYCGFWTAVGLRFFSIHHSRTATSFLLGSWLALWPFMFEKLNKTKVVFSGVSVPPKERVLLIANHSTEVDWMYLWNLALRKGCIGYIKYVLKSSLMKLPVFGWVFHIAEFIPVERKWEADESMLRQMLSTFKDPQNPLWLAVFPEGTDFTEQKCQRSQKYAIENGLPILRNVLLPKTKGFHACLECLRGSLDAVYDITIGYKPCCPSFLDNAFGINPAEVHMHVQRVAIDEIPRSEDLTGSWLMETFSRKDQLLSDFHSKGHFPCEEGGAESTVIDQGEAPDFYFQKYPEENPVLGFFTWKWVLTLGFDHMFSSPVFLGTLGLLGASLMACSYTTQIPLVKVAKRWSFSYSADAIRKQDYSDTLPRASIKDLGVVLMGAGYEVFCKGPSLYAFKGLAGRFAPIGVHLALLLIMGGATLSAVGSFRGSVTVPQGLNFVVADVLGPSGFLSKPSEAFNTEVHVNRFYMDYYDSGEVSQFHTDLSLFDLNGKEVMRKTISVNDPLRYDGLTIYQTDWSFSALQITKDGEGPFNLAMAPLTRNGDKKLFGTFLPVGNGDSDQVKGISMLARDLQSIVLYDQEGKFVGVRRPNSKLPIDIDGIKIDIVDAIGSTGLDIKTDPGVPVVYAGFGALMLTTCVSFLSHSQIWALQDGTAVVMGGKTNRAKGEFPDEMNRLLDRVPELVVNSSSSSSSSNQSDSNSG